MTPSPEHHEAVLPSQRAFRWLIAILVVMGLYLGLGIGAAVTMIPEQLVEGHTVFVSLSNMTRADNHSGQAAAVAVLIREQHTPFLGRFPGVEWFNDQYLVDPSSVAGNPWTRYPCTGAALAVESGEPDPRVNGSLSGAARYEESYHITDPNNVGWDIDKWNLTASDGHSYFAWTSSIEDRPSASMIYDQGDASCDPIVDLSPGIENMSQPVNTSLDRHCAPTCGNIRYNAVMFFFLDDFKNSGTPRNHTDPANATDVTACDNNDAAHPCPNGDDNAEGDSHTVFNPLRSYNPEPGSADCTGDGKFDEHCHRTVDVDLYYGTAPTPLSRNYIVDDEEGATDHIGCTEVSVALGVCLP